VDFPIAHFGHFPEFAGMNCVNRTAASYPGKLVQNNSLVRSILWWIATVIATDESRLIQCFRRKGAMTEEHKPVDEANQSPPANVSESASVSESPAIPVDVVATPEPAGTPIDAEMIPELLDPDQPVASAMPTDAVTGNDDDTDYEAAFMELRSTYAAKERECEALKAAAEDRQGQYLRMAADFENFRRRSQKEKEDLEVHVKCGTLSELLSVVDNFERAKQQIKPQTDGETAIHNSYQGVYKDLVVQLKKIGVAPMRAEGKPFDPNFHNAIMREPTADHPEGTVIEEMMNGYLLGDRVLRHAMVKVATPPEDGETPSDSAASE
jgi:molecular chaperone GrpE